LQLFLLLFYVKFIAYFVIHKPNKMSTQQPDEQLWKIAKQRVAFKKNLFSYIITIVFLWGIWWFTIGKDQGFNGYPWPIWPMLGWGLGLGISIL
jgi:preprotein translocase subunit YajC